MILTKEFNARLMALKVSGKRSIYGQAMTVLAEMASGFDVSKNLRAENRMPNCHKFELPEGYRIIFQKVEGQKLEFLALFVGKHEDADHFLDTHKGWIFDPQRQTLKELRWNTAQEEASNTVRSPEFKAVLSSANPHTFVFVRLSDEHLLNSGLPSDEIKNARQLNDPDSIEFMQFLERLPEQSSTVLLSYVTGSKSQREDLEALLAKQRELVTTPSSSHLAALAASSDIFVQMTDIPEEKLAFEELPFEDWMLYLHPDQKSLVHKQFNGPSRLRGVSGSGKTVVAIHRCREIAKKLTKSESKESILFLTYNRSLCELVEKLLRSLCTDAEFRHIQVSTVGKWCQDFIKFRTGAQVSWKDELIESAWFTVLRRFLPQLHQVNLCLSVASAGAVSMRDRDVQFVADEIDFIFGKFIHLEAESYLTVERLGRGRRLGPNQRTVILSIYTQFVNELARIGQRDARELARIACSFLEKGEATKNNFAAVIVDEVQDLSDIELRIVKVLGESSNNLFLVGDGAQQIYRRGQSLRSIGINVAGRSFILKKNYRNTAEIVTAATALKNAEGIGRFDEDPKVSQEDAIPSAISGERPALLVCPNSQVERELVAREIKYLVNKLGVTPAQICCMSRSSDMRTQMLSHLNSAGIKAFNYRADGVASEDAILVSTLHNVKGHEFRAVFIMGLNEGILPLDSAIEIEEIEREAALLYVAMTRAKELLYLSFSAAHPKGKSRFVERLLNQVDVLDFVTATASSRSL